MKSSVKLKSQNDTKDSPNLKTSMDDGKTNLRRTGVFSAEINRRQVAILNGDDWRRIRNRVLNYNPDVEKYENKKKERQKLSDISKNRVKQWDNTIEGQRLKKLQARKIRDEQDEIERQKIDIEEAKVQAKKRKEAIEGAKRLQYMQTDRVKGFHSALTLTEVLKERDAQIKIKLSKNNWEMERDDLLSLQQKQNYYASLQEERNKANDRFKRALENAEFQKQQINDRNIRNLEEIQEDNKEGRTIKDHYELYKAVMKDTEMKSRRVKEGLRDMNLNEMELKKEKQKEENIKDAEFDKEIKKFVSAKRKMALLRKEKEHELFQAFQDHTAKIRNQLQFDMQGRVDDEDDRIAKAVQEEEDKRKKEEEMKRKTELESIEMTNEQRLRMINDQENERKENLLRDKSFLEKRMKEDKECKDRVEANKKERRAEAIKVQTFYKQQMQNTKETLGKEKQKELEWDANNTKLLIEEEEMFQNYADKVIADAKSQKRNLFPLIKARKEGPGGGRGPKSEGNAGLRPSYLVADATGVQLPHYYRDSFIDKSVYGHVGKTENRLGFNW